MSAELISLNTADATGLVRADGAEADYLKDLPLPSNVPAGKSGLYAIPAGDETFIVSRKALKILGLKA